MYTVLPISIVLLHYYFLLTFYTISLLLHNLLFLTFLIHTEIPISIVLLHYYFLLLFYTISLHLHSQLFLNSLIRTVPPISIVLLHYYFQQLLDTISKLLCSLYHIIHSLDQSVPYHLLTLLLFSTISVQLLYLPLHTHPLTIFYIVYIEPLCNLLMPIFHNNQLHLTMHLL